MIEPKHGSVGTLYFEVRSRTRSSPAASLNTLIYNSILTLILKGFTRFLELHGTYRL